MEFYIREEGDAYHDGAIGVQVVDGKLQLTIQEDGVRRYFHVFALESRPKELKLACPLVWVSSKDGSFDLDVAEAKPADAAKLAAKFPPKVLG